MMRALFSAISGLRNHITYIDVVGNNIANVNTVAYKSDRVTFQDVLGQTLRGATAPTADRGGTNPVQVGLGMTLGSVDTLHTQGSLQATGKLTDFAIQGDGFFVLSDGARTYYSRDGAFDIAVNGDLVNPATGMKVMGWKANAGGVVDTTQPPSPLAIPFGTRISARPTSKIGFAGNLDASLPLQGVVSTTAAVYDSLGVLNTVKLSFTKVSPNFWAVSNSASNITTTVAPTSMTVTGTPNSLRPGDWTVDLDAALGTLTATFTPADFVAGPPPSLTIPGTTPEPPIVAPVVAGGVYTDVVPGLTFTMPAVLAADTTTIEIGGTIVEFDSSGQYLQSNPPVQITLTNTNGASTPQTVTLDLTRFSQYSGQGQVSVSQQDGFAAGSLVTFSVGQNGDITGVFSNGSNLLLGQVALALFTNPGGMLKAGNNQFQASSNSGDPLIGLPNSGGRGAISAGTLEGSNTDLAQQFTNIITAQRGFQASSRVITAADEMLQDLVNLKR